MPRPTDRAACSDRRRARRRCRSRRPPEEGSTWLMPKPMAPTTPRSQLDERGTALVHRLGEMVIGIVDEDHVDPVEAQPVEAVVERAAGPVGGEVELRDSVRHVMEHAGRFRGARRKRRLTLVDTTISPRPRPVRARAVARRARGRRAGRCRTRGRPGRMPRRRSLGVILADRRVQVAEGGGAEADSSARSVAFSHRGFLSLAFTMRGDDRLQLPTGTIQIVVHDDMIRERQADRLLLLRLLQPAPPWRGHRRAPAAAVPVPSRDGGITKMTIAGMDAADLLAPCSSISSTTSVWEGARAWACRSSCRGTRSIRGSPGGSAPRTRHDRRTRTCRRPRPAAAPSSSTSGSTRASRSPPRQLCNQRPLADATRAGDDEDQVRTRSKSRLPNQIRSLQLRCASSTLRC